MDRYLNLNRTPTSVADFLNLQTFGIKYRINRIKQRIDLNGIRGIDQIINPYLDDILNQSRELYKMSYDYIKSLDFNELVWLVQSRFIETPVDEDDEGNPDDTVTSICVGNTSDCDSSCKDLDELTQMLERHTPKIYTNTTTPVETATKLITKDEKDAAKLEKLRIKQQKLLDKIKIMESKSKK
jgi:hypothetical protein